VKSPTDVWFAETAKPCPKRDGVQSGELRALNGALGAGYDDKAGNRCNGSTCSHTILPIDVVRIDATG